MAELMPIEAMTQIVDDSFVEVERPVLADQRPTAERDDRLGRAFHAKGMTRPTSDSRLSTNRAFDRLMRVTICVARVSPK
jgi:hypothetical protein